MSKAEGVLATNHKAGRDYHVIETMEAGLVLVGTEIKSIRARRASIEDSFARVDGGEAILYNMFVSPYEQGGRFNVDPTRERKLLLHRKQVERLRGLLTRKGLTLVPLRLYLKSGFAKVELAVCKGKREFEKRDTIRKRELDREMRRTLKTYRRGSN